MSTGNRVALLSAAFYGLLTVLLAAVLFEFVTDLLPVGAGQVAHNSESYAAVLVLGPWVQFVRPRLHGRRLEWPVTAAAALGCLAVALVLFQADDWPTRFTTLNETFFGLAVLIPVAQPRRRAPGLSAALSALALPAIVVGAAFDSDLIDDLAESLALVMLTPIALDIFDRGILTPGAGTARGLRYGWWAFLLGMPIALRVLEYDIGFGGWFGEVTRYGVRFNEAFVFLLIFELWFAAVPPGGRAVEPAGRPERPERPDTATPLGDR